ncbi:MAG: SDR family NAD(P)-dependent oxidoreductase [Myxococcota bacterium]|nr:SDR family NAD(P)-dependent oxidoreductase [Myxococcota bacterium]
MQGRLEGKVVLVTGGAAGIGRATVLRLASEGAAVTAADVVAEGLEETAKLAAEQGSEIRTTTCDVSDEARVKAVIAEVVAAGGRLDSVVNIAGILSLDHTTELGLERWNQVLAINLTGTFLMCREALPHLLESQGSIVNTSSTSALAGMPYASAYAATKAGVLAMTRTLAVEYGKQGVRANCVAPGSIKTAMGSRANLPKDMDFSLIQRQMPIDKPRGPETVAGVVAMLVSEDGAHINGECIRVDGGTLA